jgi:hypothetical protein
MRAHWALGKSGKGSTRLGLRSALGWRGQEMALISTHGLAINSAAD